MSNELITKILDDADKIKILDRKMTQMFIISGLIPHGQITYVVVPWYEVYAWFPHKTVSGKWIWLKPIYKRQVCRSNGFIEVPCTEYGNVFDILVEE